MNTKRIPVYGLLLCGLSGCALQEIRSKTKIGPEFRHKGSDNTNAERWTAQEGIELKWDKGISTGLTYRRRDVNDGTGDNDNGVWFEFSFPLWKAKKKKDDLARRVEELEKRLAALEAREPAAASHEGDGQSLTFRGPAPTKTQGQAWTVPRLVCRQARPSGSGPSQYRDREGPLTRRLRKSRRDFASHRDAAASQGGAAPVGLCPRPNRSPSAG